MPKGVPFADHRLENAVALYLRVRPGVAPEEALEHVRAGIKNHGVKEATRQLQVALAAKEASDGECKHYSTDGETNV